MNASLFITLDIQYIYYKRISNCLIRDPLNLGLIRKMWRKIRNWLTTNNHLTDWSNESLQNAAYQWTNNRRTKTQRFIKYIHNRTLNRATSFHCISGLAVEKLAFGHLNLILVRHLSKALFVSGFTLNNNLECDIRYCNRWLGSVIHHIFNWQLAQYRC